MARPIDSLDKTLIGLLGEDGRRSLADLARRAGVSRPTAAARVRALVGDGVLRIAGLVDAFQAKGLTVALVGLTVDKHRLDEKVEQIADLPEVTWAAVVTGRYDIMAEVATEEGMNGLYDFLNVSLREVGGINSSEMFLVMKAKNRWTLMPTSMRRAWIERPADADRHGRVGPSPVVHDFTVRSVVRDSFSFWSDLGVLMC